MPTVNIFDLSPALVDGNQKIALNGAVAELQPDADVFGSVFDVVNWYEDGDDFFLLSSGQNEDGSSFVGGESAGKLTNIGGDLTHYQIGARREVNYKDADVVMDWSDSNAADDAVNYTLLLHALWKDGNNWAMMLYNAITPALAHTILAYKKVNGVATNLANSGNLFIQIDVDLRIERVAATNTFTFWYKIGGGWVNLWNGVILDAVHFPADCDMKPLVSHRSNGVAAGSQPVMDQYYQNVAHRYYVDSPTIYVIDNALVEWALDAGVGMMWELINAACTKTEPGTSTVLFKVGVSDTGLLAGVTWVDVAWQTIAQVSANAAAGLYDGRRYVHVQSQFSSAGPDKPDLTDLTINGNAVMTTRTRSKDHHDQMRRIKYGHPVP